MAAKKKKGILHKDLHPDTESIVIGSGIALLFAVFLKTLLIAIPVGLIFAFTHKYGIGKQKQKGKS